MKTLQDMLHSKSGSSYWLIYALLFGFALTFLFIIFNETLKVYIYPTTIMLTNASGTAQTSYADKWISYWDFMPFIIVLIVGIFIFFRTTQNDTVDR